MFSKVKFKKLISFLVCVLTIISMSICSFNIEFYYDKGAHLSFNNYVYAAESDPAIDICTIAAGLYHTLAIMDDGTVKAWGNNEYGKSGLGYITYSSAPTVINGLTGVKQIAAGYSHTLALMNDETVKAWGDNSKGQLGLGYITYSITPTVINGLTGVKQIAAGDSHTLALMNDGTVKAWGENSKGQLGLGDTTYRSTPIVINGLIGVKQIIAGGSHTLALMNDGTVKAWGDSSKGQLGLGDTTYRSTPTIINGLIGVKQIAAGYYHTLALMDDGTVKAWGNNSSGQLGLGNTTYRSTPTVINGLIGVKQIAAGYSHTLALMNDYTVSAWGNNNSGQLGLGDTTYRSTPTVINGLTGVKQMSAGGFHSLALMNGGTVKAWGENSSGQLGLRDTSDRTIPVGILGLYYNFEPNLSIQIPSLGYKFTASQNSFTPEIVASDSNNDAITCKYYLNSETIPRETKTVLNTATEQIVDFNPVNLNTMSDGNYTIRFEASDGQNIVQLEVDFIIDRETPLVSTITYSSDATSISVKGIVLNNNLYKYTIGTTSTDWITDTSYIWKTLIPNTAYTVKFETKDKEGNIVTDQKTIYTKAQSPKVSIGGVDKTSFDMYIEDSNSPATEYQIISGTSYVASTGSLTPTPTWITIPSKTLKITGLTPNKKLNFKVKARNGDGIETVYSVPVEISTLTDPPLCPSGFTADLAKISNTAIVLNWDSVTAATGYDIEADGIIRSTTRTSFQHTGLTPNTQHTYRVRAKNTYGVSEWSPIVTVMTTFSVPGNMTNLNAYAEDNLVILTWEDVLDAEYYEIEFDGNVSNNGPDPYSTKVGLAPSSQHSYRVRAVNTAGEGQWSSITSVTTYPIGTPKNIKTVEEEYAVTLSWEQVNDASSYEIQVNEQVIATVTDTTYRHTSLTPETQYIYKIRAIGLQGIGGFSNNISIYTLPVKPKVPENITASVTNNVVTLIWDSADTAIGYDVELDGVLIDNGNSTTYIHDELLKSTNHMYRVRAKNDAIEGEWSSLLALKTMQGKPTSPDNIKVSTTSTITTLVWDAQDDAISYDIEVDGKITDNISKTSYRHRRITPLTEHVYRIRTRNVTGISPWSGYMINNSIKAICKKYKDVELGLTASDIIDFSKYTLTVAYNNDVLEVMDLCTFSPKIELTKGTIEATGITITEFSPGKIVFVVDKSIPPEESWTGVINSIKFKAKVSGGTNITYTVFSKPEE